MSGGIFLTTAKRPDENYNTTPLKLPKVEPLKFQRTK